MDCGSHKFYHVHGMDSRQCLESFFSDKPDMVFADETLRFPMEKLHQVFSAGNIKGDVLMDISPASFVHLLYSACGYFKDIYILKFSEKCIMEMNKWRHTRTGAFDWNHTFNYVTQLEGNSDSFDDIDMRLKTRIKQFVKCNIDKENLTDPIVLPLADCIISAWLLGSISKDRDDYVKNVKKIAKCLQPGGHLILVGSLNATYYTVGQDKIHFLKYDEDFDRGVLTGEGFIIDHCDVFKRKSVSDLADHDGIIFIAAHKEKV